MADPTPRPRPPPVPVSDVRLSSELRHLIQEAYPDLATSSDILLTIELHLRLLNSQGRTEDAIAFVRDCAAGARNEIQQRNGEKRRVVLKLIGGSTLTASIGIAIKFIATKFGIT